MLKLTLSHFLPTCFSFFHTNHVLTRCFFSAKSFTLGLPLSYSNVKNMNLQPLMRCWQKKIYYSYAACQTADWQKSLGKNDRNAQPSYYTGFQIFMLGWRLLPAAVGSSIALKWHIGHLRQAKCGGSNFKQSKGDGHGVFPPC